MEVEVWDEDFSDNFLTIKYHDVDIDFDIWLEDMTVLTYCNSIKMDHAEISSDLVKNLERTHANKRVTRFFNQAFDMIIPWANEFHPKGVTSIPIPDTLVDLVHIRKLKMAVRDNYFSFTLDPEFIMKTHNDRRQLSVKSTAQDEQEVEVVNALDYMKIDVLATV